MSVALSGSYFVFFNHRILIANSIHEIYRDKPFIDAIGKFSNAPLKISKHIFLGYPMCSPTLLIPIDSTLIPHISESLGYIPLCKPGAVKGPPLTPKQKAPLDPCHKLVNTTATSTSVPSLHADDPVSMAKQRLREHQLIGVTS